MMDEFLLHLRHLALEQPRRVIAIEFELVDGEILLRFRFA